jgi:hypothetical protein
LGTSQVGLNSFVIPALVVFAQATPGIDLGPLQRLMSALACALIQFGPFLAFLFFVIGAVLVVAASNQGTKFIAYGLFGLAVVAAAPRIMGGITGLFGLQAQLRC